MSEDHQEDSQVVLWCAEGLNQEQVEELRGDIRHHQEDPAFLLITNFFLSRVEIPPTPTDAVVIAEGASQEQLQVLREELDKAEGDADYVAVVPFNVSVLVV